MTRIPAVSHRRSTSATRAQTARAQNSDHNHADARVGGQLQAQRGQAPRGRQSGQDRDGKSRRRDADSGQPGQRVDSRWIAGERGEHRGIRQLDQLVVVPVRCDRPEENAVAADNPLLE
jgi:hypothetical protein